MLHRGFFLYSFIIFAVCLSEMIRTFEFAYLSVEEILWTHWTYRAPEVTATAAPTYVT